jgi:hypothetical protein
MASADKPIGDDLLSEMSDSELLVAAEQTGTFDFLDAPEEDGYNDLFLPR